MFIELHMLQNFAPSNLNRDESNNPKDCYFGGTRRARISSQCIKRSVRLHPAFAEETGVEPGSRTRLLAQGISEILRKQAKPAEEADLAAQNIVGGILGKMDAKVTSQSAVLFYVSKEEKEDLARIALENWSLFAQKTPDAKLVDNALKSYKNKFTNRTSAPDIAMFGRMLAQDPKLNLDAACQVAHAISTHRANMEFDFFTAVDDLQKEGETGAGMMGIVGFNAATFYRFSTIDFEQLLKNLDGDEELAKKTIRGFLKASALAIPSGKQNSFAAQNPPSFLLAVVRPHGGSWSMANAFEKPINPFGEKGLLTASIEALDQYWGEVQRFYGDQAKPSLALVGVEAELKNLGGYRSQNLNEWADSVILNLSKE